ncbi:calcium-binding protein [Rhodopirellula bahusiensis]|uniref:calcium-binding protein n=1 Tax=Rhodopirellula bahusiensis TaxID=2014065 RepID=UPI00117AE1E0|nr:calcium-binding protein [Rhodopirellula bahusiensis]
MNIEHLLKQLRQRSNRASKRVRDGSERKVRTRRALNRRRRARLESLEDRRLLASDVSLSGDTLLVAGDDDVHNQYHLQVVEFHGTESFQISSNTFISEDDPALSDMSVDEKKVVVGTGSISGVEIRGGAKDNVFTVGDLSGYLIQLDGEAGTDGYVLKDQFGTVAVNDTGGAIDLTHLTSPWTTSLSGGTATVEVDGGASTATIPNANAYTMTPNSLSWSSALTAINEGLEELASLGDELVTHDRLLENQSVLNQKSVGSFLPIGEIFREKIANPVASYFSSGGSPEINVWGLLEELQSVKASSQLGDALLNWEIDAEIIGTSDRVTLALEITAELVHSSVDLSLPDSLLNMDGTLENSLGVDELKANLTTGFTWDLSIGWDVSSVPYFFVDFTDDVRVTATIDDIDADFKLNAGLLGLEVGKHGPASASSSLQFDFETTLPVSELSSLDGKDGGASDGVVQTIELQSSDRMELLSDDANPSAQLDVDLYAVATGISGISESEAVHIQWSDDLYSEADPVLSEDLTTSEFDPFFQSDATTLLQMAEQFSVFLDTLSAKTVDSSVVPLTESLTVADLVDVSGVYESLIVEPIRLPQHTSATSILTVNGGDPLGTSEDSDSDLVLQLRSGETHPIDLDAGNPKTLGHVVQLIVDAVNDSSKLQLVEDPKLGLMLADLTTGDETFQFTAETNSEGEEYAAVGNLGLDAVAVERDVLGDTSDEWVIDVAPVNGPKFASIQSFAEQIEDLPASVVTGLAYDADASGGPTLSFEIVIDQSIADLNDNAMSLIDMGDLEQIDLSAGTIDVSNARIQMRFPFELLLTEVGGDVALATPLAELNDGRGVSVTQDTDGFLADLDIRVGDGTTFSVDLDLGLGGRPLADFGIVGGSGSDLSVTLNDGSGFDVELDDTVASTGNVAATLAELFELINASATDAGVTSERFTATIDAARSSLRFLDKTTGASAFSVSGRIADALAFGASVSTEVDGNEVMLFEKTVGTLGDLMNKITDAAEAAGLTLYDSGNPGASWDFGVRLAGAGIEIVDQTVIESVITGTAETNTADDELHATGQFSGETLAFRTVTITGGVGEGQTRTILSNTDDVLMLSESWDVQPDATSQFEVNNGLFVSAANQSAAAFGLGLTNDQREGDLERTVVGSPLHGDTPSRHLQLKGAAEPHIQLSMDLDEGTLGAGTGIYGPLDVAVSAVSVNAASFQADLTLRGKTLDRLNAGLEDPFSMLLEGGNVVTASAFDVSLQVGSYPSVAIDGATGTTPFDVSVGNVFDVQSGDEVLVPTMSSDDDVRALLQSLASVTMDDFLSTLDSVSEYLFELQTQSKLGKSLPGLPKSVGSMLGFGENFETRLDEIRDLPISTLQQLHAALNDTSARTMNSLAGTLATSLSFEKATSQLLFDLHYLLEQINPSLPLTLNLTSLGDDLNAAGDNLQALGLRQVAAIVDSSGTSLLDVVADGEMHVVVGMDLTNPDAPATKLVSDPNADEGTRAEFHVKASSAESMNFPAVLGSMAVGVFGGQFALNLDGVVGTSDSATYKVKLQSDVDAAKALEGAALPVTTKIDVAGEAKGSFGLVLPESVIPQDAPTHLTPNITVEVTNLNDIAAANPSRSSTLSTNMSGNPGEWATFETLTQNFSLTDSMEGFKLGVQRLFRGLDDVFDTALLGQDLPLVGKQLADAANFLDQIGESVYANLDLLPRSGITMDSVHVALFDAFGPGGFGWLQDSTLLSNPDTFVNIDDVGVTRETIVTASGRELVTGVEYRMDLEMTPESLQFPIDLDLLLPGLGLTTEALADVKFGFKMPLIVGVSVLDGVYLDVASDNEVEVSLDISLPNHVASLSGEPSLSFFNTDLSQPKISRDQGSWIFDGFKVGQIIEVEGSDNVANNDGRFVITAIDSLGTELTLAATDEALAASSLADDRVVPEGPTKGIQVQVSTVSMTGGNAVDFNASQQTITRGAGSWLEDGFRVGDTITVDNAGSNDGSWIISAIDAVGRTLTLEDGLTVNASGVAGVRIRSNQQHGFDAEMGVLPYRVWDATPDQSEFTGTFVFDLHDPNENGSQTRLSVNDLDSQPEFPVAPRNGFTAAPLSGFLTLTEGTGVGQEIVLNDISLQLETNLPRTAAFPPFRAQLDVTNWDWGLSDSLLTKGTPDEIAFNDVQFELVGFVRDFLGPSLTRFRAALEPMDGVIDFLTSEAMPILSALFGRTSYASAPGIFGGRSEAGDFAGAADVIRKLVDGGTPSHTGFTNYLDLIGFADSKRTLTAINDLTGQHWIDMGRFDVSVSEAMSRNATVESIYDESSNAERLKGDFGDAPLRLSGSPDLVFDSNDGSIARQNVVLTDQTFDWGYSAFAGSTLTSSVPWSTYGVTEGFTLTVENLTGGSASFNGVYKVGVVSGNTAWISREGFSSVGSSISVPRMVGNASTWTSEGFQSGQTIRIEGGANAGTYTVDSVSETVLSVTSSFVADEVVPWSEAVNVRVQNAVGDYSGSIKGQINAVLNDPLASAQQAAASFLMTQTLPGRGIGYGFDLLGGVTREVFSPIDSALKGFDPIELPILNQAFGLLIGDTTFDGKSAAESNLLHYSTPELQFTLYQDFPLDKKTFFCEVPFGSAFASSGICDVVSNGSPTPFVSVSFEARMDYGVAVDTTGLELYRDSGNPDAIIEGFYFDDTDGVDLNPSLIGGNESGPIGTSYGLTDVPQSRILGGIGVGVFRKFGTALGSLKVGVEMSFHTGQDLNFHDPNGDGRIRASEFDVLTETSVDDNGLLTFGDSENAFDKSVRIEVRGDAFLKIKALFITVIDVRVNIFTIGFNIPLEDKAFTSPDLATLSGGTLKLNVGKESSTRGYRTDNANEAIYVGYNPATNEIVVSGFGSQSERFDASSVSLIEASADTGNDLLFVHANVTRMVSFDGGAGDDVLFGGSGPDELVGGLGNDSINGRLGDDSIWGDLKVGSTGGLDWLFGGDGRDTIYGGPGIDVIRGWRDDDDLHGGDGDDLIDGGQGNDSLHGDDGVDFLLGNIGHDMIVGGAKDDRLEGGPGRDALYGESGEDILFGGLGNDSLDGGADIDSLYGQHHNDSLQGGAADDLLDGGLGSDQVYGGDGDDLVYSRDGNDRLDGEEGDDTFKVYFARGKVNSLLSILDTGMSGVDVFDAIGTIDPDQFLLRASVSGTNAFVAVLTDPDHSSDEAAYNPSVQRVNYLGVERILVQGGMGDDQFAIDDTAAEVTIDGGDGDDAFQVGQLFRSQRTEVDANVSVDDVFATIETTRGFLSNGISQPMTISGGLGDDHFVVFHNQAVLTLNGNEGDDGFEVRAFALVGSREPQRARTDITGGAGADLVQYAVNAPVNIDGGDGFDTLTVIGTEFGDDFVITEDGVYGAGLTIDFTNIESLRVDAAEGNDRFYVKSTSEKFLTELFGGLGDDTFNLSGDTPPVVSNDLKGHSGIVTNNMSYSSDLRYEDLKLHGVSSNVADNEEPFVVIRTSNGSTIVGETGAVDASVVDFYEIVLTQAPMSGFDVLVQALAPLPSTAGRELGALAFRLSSVAPGSEKKADGSAVTLTFTSENWFIPQRVDILADDEVQLDTGRLFTRDELSESDTFSYDDAAFEGKQSAVINHIVSSTATTIVGTPLVLSDSPTITIETSLPSHEFVGETITVTSSDGLTTQTRRITDARLVGGNLQLTVDRSWLAGTHLPDTSSNYSIVLAESTEAGHPVDIRNTTFTVNDPSDPTNPLIEEPKDFLGRQITIIDGSGVGQSRFITGADQVVTFASSAVEIDRSNPKTFAMQLSTGGESVTPTTGGMLNLRFVADLDYNSETIEVTLDGSQLDVLFNDYSGRQYSFVQASIPLTQSQLQAALTDGRLELGLIPSDSVNNLDDYYDFKSSVSFDLQFHIDVANSNLVPGIGGDVQFTLDRGWSLTNPPALDSRYQIAVDDSLVGRVSDFDESPVGLPADPSFPAELDTRTTFVDSDADFTAVEFGAEGLRGATIEIVGGPGAGQRRLILDAIDANTLILNGDWRTDPVAGESVYRIARFDGLAVSSVSVEVNDNDEAGIVVDETHGLDLSESTDGILGEDTVTAVIEGGDGDQLGERDVLRLKLTRQPSSDVTMRLVYDDVQLSLQTTDGHPIASNSLVFTPGNWDVVQEVMIIGLVDQIREGFHVSQISLELGSEDLDQELSKVDQFNIPETAAVEWVGLSERPTGVTSVEYKGQNLQLKDDTVPAGTESKPVYAIVSNKIVFFAGEEVVKVSGSDLTISYNYVNPGFGDAFTHPVLVRISDADAPTVLVRETGGSTDVVEGATPFMVLELDGDAIPTSDVVGETVTVSDGTGVGQTATIIANEGNQITLDTLWETVPDETSELTLIVSGNAEQRMVTSNGTLTWGEDRYELVLTSPPVDDVAAGRRVVEVVVTPEVTKTTRTGGVRTDARQVEIFNLDGLDASRVRVDPDNANNLIVAFDETNWDVPVRIGVRVIDDLLVDGGDTKVFAPGPNTLSGILGPVIVNGSGGDGSLAGLGNPEILPQETNVKPATGEVESIVGTTVTFNTLTSEQLFSAGLVSDLSNVQSLVGRTFEVVATKPAEGSPRDPVVGQFRLITEATVQDGQVVVTLNERFGLGGDLDSLEAGAHTSSVDLRLSRQEQLRLGIANVGDLYGRTIELNDADGQMLSSAVIKSAVADPDGLITIDVEADWISIAADATSFFIQSDDLVKKFAITSESLNFFVNEQTSVDYMFVHDEDSPADSTGYLTADRLWGLNTGPDVTVGGRLQPGGIQYGNLEVLQISLGRGNNDFHVFGTHKRADDPTTSEDESFQTWTIINGGDDVYWPATDREGDRFYVDVIAEDITDVMTGSVDCKTDEVTSLVTCSTDAGETEFASLFDSAAHFGGENELVGMKVTMTSGVGTGHTYTIVEHTEDTIYLLGNWIEIPAVGDTYTITDLADGPIAINAQGGDDVVDASASTLGVVAFGGLGKDTLIGGSGDDILFGDRGRVDYSTAADANGHTTIVTRLGDAPDPILGTVTGGFAEDGNVVDANAAFPLKDVFDNGLVGLMVDINNGTGFLQTPRLITVNDENTLSISPDFTETLDATSEFRISTYPEDQTDGIVRGPTRLITVDDLEGDVDMISGGAGADQIFGGAGDDDVFGEAGDDVILGDTGVIKRAPLDANATGTVIASALDLVQTKSPDAGGKDLISGGDDNDIIFGGFESDYINYDRAEVAGVGESGNDIIVGDGGTADFDVASGAAILIEVSTNEPTFGSDDWITAGAGEKILFGGSGDDQLLAGSDNLPDIIIGDEGTATFDAGTGLRVRIATQTADIGGNDTITAGDALNILLGGSGDDAITGGNSQDVIFGDNGEIKFDDHGIREQLNTTDPTLGGVDTIFGRGGNDIVVGGADGDLISGGSEHDVILGDHGEVDFTRPADRNVISRFIELTDGGGNDTIDGDDGDDFIWGGQADDVIRGGAGQDDLVGGHNVPFGSDGDDTIEGGDDEDALLGDNGIITRELIGTELGTWTTYLAPFDHVVVRELQPFDDLDLVGGNDILSGDAGIDVILGQRGNDLIHGGTDDDELIGGLGADTINGDDGHDFILADAGQILRDTNEDETPQLNSDGVWHRDILTERIARVIDIIPLGPTGLIDAPADLIDRLLDADQMVLASMHLPSGQLHTNSEGISQTVALLLDLVDADDDTVDGGDGNDIVLGQRGDDNLRGGLGDDLLIGDHGINVAPYETDLPQMIDATRLIAAVSGYDSLSGIELDLPGLGHLMVPDFVAEPGALVAERPRWDRVTDINAVFSNWANDDRISTMDNLRLSASVMLTPDFLGHTDVLSGEDTIHGEGGDDWIVGDQWIVNSDLQSGIAPVDEAIERVRATIAGIMHALESASLDRGVVQHSINAEPVVEREIDVASDELRGGDGADTIIGDNALVELPSTQTIPGAGTVAENAAELLRRLDLYRTLSDDAIQLVSRGHLDLIDQLLDDAEAARPTLPVIAGNDIQYVQHYQLKFGDDSLFGDAGSDTMVGGDALMIAPYVTGEEGDFPDSQGAVGLDPDSLRALEQNLFEQLRLQQVDLDERHQSRLINVAEELARRPSLDRIAYVPTLDRSIDNDTIEGGEGNDFIGGDFGVLVSPLLRDTPADDDALRDLDQHVEAMLDQIANLDRLDHATSFDRSVGREAQAASTTDAMAPELRHAEMGGQWILGQDTLQGDAGSDVILGDHASMVAAITIDDPAAFTSLRRSNYHLEFIDDSMRTFLESSSLNGVTISLQGDHIRGGDDNDMLMGAVGADDIDGEQGDDTILGGNGFDTLADGLGNNWIRNDGGNYPKLDPQEELGAFRFDNMTSVNKQLFLDAAAGAIAPVGWQIDSGGNENDPGNGDPDDPAVPTERDVDFDGDFIAVTGQPISYSATFKSLPDGAIVSYLWEVKDSSGELVQTGAGQSVVFTLHVADDYTVEVDTVDTKNGAGTMTHTLKVLDHRLKSDPHASGQFILMVGGTEGDNDIRLKDVRLEPNSVEVRTRTGRSSWTRDIFSDISRVEVYGGDGNDDVSADRTLTIPVRLYGGAGDDELRGGAGNDFLDGGAGDDRLNGQSGNDVIVGGYGADRIDGGFDDDLLIADAIDEISADRLLRDWSNSSLTPADRMANLVTDLLDAKIADGAVDDSDGDRGTDWVFGQSIDTTHARRGDEDLQTIY